MPTQPPTTAVALPISPDVPKRDRPRLPWLVSLALMCCLAVGWMSYQSWRYFAVTHPGVEQRITPGGIDVQNRFIETQSWFRGDLVYGVYADAVYPPASYALFKMVFNGLGWGLAKPLWYLLSLAAGGYLSWQLVRHSLANTWWERWFLGLMPFAFYSVGAALGNGQLMVFVLPLVLTAVLLLNRPQPKGQTLCLGAVLMLFALIQPAIAAPFFWLLLLVVPKRVPAILVVLLYLLATVVAILFQVEATRNVDPAIQSSGRANAGAPAYTGYIFANEDANRELKAGGDDGPIKDWPQKALKGGKAVWNQWTRQAQSGAKYGSQLGGYGTVHNLLGAWGLSQYNGLASVAILATLGAWIWRNRRGDLWLLLAVTAIVARVWTYHRWYDDLLLLVPMTVLFRITKQPQYSVVSKTIAAGLFLWLWLFLLAPGVLYFFAAPAPLVAMQVTGWLVTWLFLALVADRGRKQPILPTEPVPSPDSSAPSPATV